MKQQLSRKIFLLAAIVTLSACVYRMDVLQGNRINSDTVSQLEIGMSRKQVEFLLGSPAIVGPYQPDLWHYVYYFKNGDTRNIEKSVMTLTFTGDLLLSIEGDLIPG
jgi:outer membrane protein assembly factor BamE